MSASGYPFISPDGSIGGVCPKKSMEWVEGVYKFEDNYYAIVRHYDNDGGNGFTWVVDNADFDFSLDQSDQIVGYISPREEFPMDFPIWNANVFITNDYEKLFRMWIKCKEDKEHTYRIVGLNLRAVPIDFDDVESKMKSSAREEILKKLSHDDRKILEDS